ncbi:MAG: glycosyltransferase family 4 protein [Pseudomonadota bacterium]
MKSELSVLAITQGREVPSSRFRIKNISLGLEQYGIVIKTCDSHFSSYPPAAKVLRPFWFVKTLLFKMIDVIRSYSFDAVILQREFISTIPTIEGFTKRPRILDVDDAIWLHRKGWATHSIAKKVDHIVCGNKYLADYFNQFGKPVSIIPTSVDTNRFSPRQSQATNKIIGWSGTSGGYKYLYAIESALSSVLHDNPDWTLRVVSDQPPKFKIIPQDRIEYIQWSEDNEVVTIADMDIGLMPIDNTAWSKGKCSYKMLLYMACCLPVVVSDFGMNHEILRHGFVGYGARTEQEWYRGISNLIKDKESRLLAGKNGRKIVIDCYSIELASSMWGKVIRSVTSCYSSG